MTTTAFVEAARQLVRGLKWAPGHENLRPYFSHASRALEWRHNGLGMLQAELSETLRIHIWHPSLVAGGMTWPRCVHDHRFDIDSAVIVGAIFDVPCQVRFDAPVLNSVMADVYRIRHAKTQDGSATDVKFVEHCFVSSEGSTRHEAGVMYHIERRTFHTSRVKDLAVSVVHRSHFDENPARVLCPTTGERPTSGIVHDDSLWHRLLVDSTLRAAAAAIERMP